MNNELQEELDAFDKNWRLNYATLREAAEAANCLPLYYTYIATEQGTLRQITLLDVPDTLHANRLERRMRERMLKRSNRSNFDDTE